MTNVLFTRKSGNAKVGRIPVTTTDRQSCPSDCPFKGNGCYAESGPLRHIWDAISDAPGPGKIKRGRGSLNVISWDKLCYEVKALPDGQIWRHNQAGDLPQHKFKPGTISRSKVNSLIEANKGKRGFTYTHHNVTTNALNRETVRRANALGFTVNLSANSVAECDSLADLDIGPVVTVLPSDIQGKADIRTPKGRRVVVCPATYQDKVNCASCQLCQRQRDVIVGFPAHGTSKRKASAIAS